MPRYITREEREANARLVNQIVGENEAEIAANEEHRAWRRTILSDRTPYGRGSPHSFFYDLAASRRDLPDQEAVERLNRQRSAAEKEKRAISTTTLGGISPTIPVWLDATIEAAVRSSAPLYASLTRLPLPPQGVVVQFQKYTAGSSGQVQASENSTVTVNDPAVTAVSEPFSTLMAEVDYSYQVHDRGGDLADRQIAQDLSAAFGAKIESELWVGTGSGGRIRGLTQASPTTSVAVSSTTAAGNVGGIWNLFQQFTTAYGKQPDLLAVAPRRYAFWEQMVVGAPATMIPQSVQLVVSPQAPTNLGGGTNEDRPYFLFRDAVPLVTNPPTIDVQLQQAGTSLQAKAILHAYAAFATAARPEAMGVLTGLVSATFS
jgi:hypothetical protein